METSRPLFDSLPAPERHIRRLETSARLLGLSPAPIERANVLDIGCGLGALVLAMASEFPDASFVGVDFSDEYLAKAREAQQAIGVSNLVLKQADIKTFTWDGTPFDYIIVHGLYSWVDLETREALLKSISSLLSPAGIAAVSFNPWPGVHQRDVLGHAVRHCAPAADDATLVKNARALFEAAKGILSDAASPAALALNEAIERSNGQSDRHLLHSLLLSNVTSTSLPDFVESAAQYGLGFLCDARPSHWKGERYRLEHLDDEDSAVTFDKLASSELALEFVLDALAPAPFRTSLLHKSDRTFTSKATIELIQGMYAASAITRSDVLASERSVNGRFYTPGGGEVSAPFPWFAELLELMERRWPESVPVSQLIELVPTVSKEELCTVLYSWFLPELIELEVTPSLASTTVDSKPTVHPLARYQARTQEWVTTYRHGYATLDPFASAVCSLCDGSRDVTEIAQLLLTQAGDRMPPDVTAPDLEIEVHRVLGTFRERALLR